MRAALYKGGLYESNSGLGYLYENSPFIRLTCMRATLHKATCMTIGRFKADLYESSPGRG
jgi:hypothetical protein